MKQILVSFERSKDLSYIKNFKCTAFICFLMTRISLKVNASSYVKKQGHQSNKRYLITSTTLCSELSLSEITNLHKPSNLQKTPPDQ